MGRHYPSYLELIQAQVFFRHGERSPIVTRFSSQSQWAFCERANYLYSEFMTAIGKFVPRQEAMPSPNPDLIASGHSDPRYTKRTATLKSGIEYEPAAWSLRLTQDSEKALDGNTSGSGPVAAAEDSWEPTMCDMGQLTDVGLDSLFRTGSFLRSLYVDKLNFLPPTPEGKVSDYIYVRTTDYSRVIQSTHALLVGLYPGHPQSAWTGRWTTFNKGVLGTVPHVYASPQP
ncbi:phosphoglycerate mutase-like protein [Linderina pennispora]|uniref:Phosphoglycerate mutase-like protein n=1 Tax=Linderina pennispora TaxID=61395 RepID=A0A1Y1WNJ7_9FUNG|nr:phosphoglycerate mutase-like protein [Linderina pennispora]ORX75042.1 phosphoglycerate mutase-like protein [Linderina pennispora]